MASDGSKSIRKDFKFESYLRRVLKPETYSKIRYYDMCIIVNEKGDRAFKRLIVGDQFVYVTDDPPKNLKELFHLKDMVSIELLRDYPDFMEGEARKTVQHLLIKFMRDVPPGKTRRGGATKTNGTQPLDDSGLPPGNQTADPIMTIQNQAPPLGPTEQSKSAGCCGGLRSRRAHARGAAAPPEPPPAAEPVPAGLATTGTSADYQSGDVGSTLPGDILAATNPLTQSAAQIYNNGGVNIQRKEIPLHIYILNQDTPAMMLIKSAWNNYLLRGTLLLDPVYLERSTPKVAFYPDDERLKMTFRQLKGDLESNKNSPESVFQYTNELYNACMRHFSIKKLFWASGDLFELLVDQVGRVLPDSHHPLTAENRQDRVDELEFALLILDTLTCVLEETEAMSERVNTLSLHNNRAAFELIRVIISDTSLPRKADDDDPPSVRYSQFEEDKLMQGITNAGVSVLTALLKHARESHVHLRDELTEAGIIHFIETNLETSRLFIRRSLTEIFEMISPRHGSKGGHHHADSHQLTPLQAVLLYRHFSLLESAVRYSSTFLAFLADNYHEEFKYFVQPQIVMQRMAGGDFPIRLPTLRLIHKITGSVTGVSVDFHSFTGCLSSS